MKQRDENRSGRRVTVVEPEPHELPPEQRIAALEARIAVLETDAAELKRPLTPSAK
ncbi:MAG: hypothetical protein ACM3ZA_00970 [Bacillota bacterium]